MIEGRGVELDELHVFDSAFGAVDHGYAVAGGYEGVGGGAVDGSASACGYEGDAGEESIDVSGGCVEDVGSVTGDVGGASRDYLAQVVLGDDFDGEVVFVDVDVGVGADGFDERVLYLEAGVVGVVEYAKLGVSAFAVEVEGAVIVFVEVYAPAYEFVDLRGSVAHDFLDGLRVAEPVAGHHCVVDMFVEVVDLEVGDGCYAALCEGGVGFVESGLAYEGH